MNPSSRAQCIALRVAGYMNLVLGVFGCALFAFASIGIAMCPPSGPGTVCGQSVIRLDEVGLVSVFAVVAGTVAVAVAIPPRIAWWGGFLAALNYAMLVVLIAQGALFLQLTYTP